METSAYAMELTALLRRQAVADGFSPSRLPEVRYLRSLCNIKRGPVLYDPGIVFLASGRKNAWLGDRAYELDPLHYWVLSVPLPFECETRAAPDGPLYGLFIRADSMRLSELLLEVDAEPFSAKAAREGLCASSMTEPLAGALVRLLSCLESPEEARILGAGIIREIFYRVLGGEQGAQLRAVAAQDGHFHAIARALRLMHTGYAENLSVEALAQEARLGVSTFHHVFKAVTATTPLRYLKQVRLHNARRYLAEAGVTAGEAARRVGYLSASQFSREFKEFFGSTPKDEAVRLRQPRSGG